MVFLHIFHMVLFVSCIRPKHIFYHRFYMRLVCVVLVFWRQTTRALFKTHKNGTLRCKCEIIKILSDLWVLSQEKTSRGKTARCDIMYVHICVAYLQLIINYFISYRQRRSIPLLHLERLKLLFRGKRYRFGCVVVNRINDVTCCLCIPYSVGYLLSTCQPSMNYLKRMYAYTHTHTQSNIFHTHIKYLYK